MNAEFFNNAFEGTFVPQNIRKASEQICMDFNIRGVCDPMYIANVIAKELNIGDGCSKFTGGRPNYENLETLANRLKLAYGCNITSEFRVKQIITSKLFANSL